MSTVLVTGVSRYLGARVAARLAADPAVHRVIGVDADDPPPDSPRVAGVNHVRLDLAAPGIAEVIDGYRVDTVVHLAVARHHRARTPEPAPPAAGSPTDRPAGEMPPVARVRSAKEQNVIGTLHLLAACQRSPGVRTVVVRSSTAAYGASFRDPAVFTEDTEPGERPRGGFARDVLDIEGYVRGFRRRRPDVVATVLRFAPFLGRAANTSLARYFALPIVPTVLGRDPRLQFIHVDDALEILHRSARQAHPGTYNAAGAGVILLSQAVRRAGRIPLPVFEPGLTLAAGLARGRVDFSLDQLDLFVHGRVVDTGRLVREYGFTPRTTVEAFDDFLQGIGAGPVRRNAVRSAERAVYQSLRVARPRTGS